MAGKMTRQKAMKYKRALDKFGECNVDLGPDLPREVFDDYTKLSSSVFRWIAGLPLSSSKTRRFK